MAAGAESRHAALEHLAERIAGVLAEGLSVARDNPGATPPTWSVNGAVPILTFGLVDGTFFWTWDAGVSNHYSKDAGTAADVILAELRRFGHLA